MKEYVKNRVRNMYASGVPNAEIKDHLESSIYRRGRLIVLASGIIITGGSIGVNVYYWGTVGLLIGGVSGLILTALSSGVGCVLAAEDAKELAEK